jgi:hypothetical protein
MSKSPLHKILKNSYLYDSLPETICIPAIGDQVETVFKPVELATLDELAFAAQALDQESDAIYSRLSAVRRLYREGRANGGLGSDNIVDALSKKGGAK